MRQWRLAVCPHSRFPRNITHYHHLTVHQNQRLFFMHVLIGILNSTTSLTIHHETHYILTFQKTLFCKSKAVTVRWRLQVYSKLLPFWQQLLQLQPLLLPPMLVSKRYVFLSIACRFPELVSVERTFCKIDSGKESTLP